MWSRRFLWIGLSSGAAAAALALAGLWLAWFVVDGTKNPTRTWANIVLFALPGLIVYPACWYVVIFCHRDYSLYRTMKLVVATFGTVSVVVGAVMIIGGFYVAITMLLGVAQPWKMAPIAALAPLAYALMTVIGAILLIIPYLIVATPIALIHRWLLLQVLAPTGPAAPSIRSSVPIIPLR
jgi:hypothetical protein